MKPKIKIISEETREQLEAKVNDFLKEKNNYKIIDIKYAINGFHSMLATLIEYSVLIMYEVKE